VPSTSSRIAARCGFSARRASTCSDGTLRTIGRLLARLVLIGLVAGFFSALLGVGGGIVVVPLLLLVNIFSERPAMATSLASIGVIALVGSVSYSLHGDVHLGYAVLLGLPAAVGAVGGTALQQRIGGPALSLAFAGLLAAIGIWLLV
jgi:uncharacterized membrane protein YfcA